MAYNTRNLYANGITERVDDGLGILGQSLVKTCNEARGIVDVSHTDLQSTMDTIEASSQPVVLSYANARDEIDGPRNISDEVLKAVTASGGFSSAVGYPPCVSKNKQPLIKDYVRMVDLVAVDHVAIGVDCDSSTPRHHAERGDPGDV